MKRLETKNIQDLLKHYKIDVENIDLEDTFELEDMFHTRSEIVKMLETLNFYEIKEFLEAESILYKYLPEIKRRYKIFYERKVEPINKEIKNKLKSLKEYISIVYA